jgi:hypothetical protein
LLGWIACGGSLTDDDLAELPLDDVDRNAIETRIREAATEIVAHRRDGARGQARSVARDVANELAAIVNPRTPPPTEDDPDHPRNLAALVRRS